MPSAVAKTIPFDLQISDTFFQIEGEDDAVRWIEVELDEIVEVVMGVEEDSTRTVSAETEGDAFF